MTDAQIRSTIIIVGTVLFIVVLMILLRTVRTKEHNQHLHVQKKLRESQQRELEGYETSIQNLIAEIANKSYDTEAALALSEQCQDYMVHTAVLSEKDRRKKDLLASNLINGGRGIGNMVESILIDPLSRILMKKHVEKHSILTITGLNADGSLTYNIETRE